MTRAKTGKKSPAKPAITVEAQTGETKAQTMSRALVAPYLRHGILTHGINDKTLGKVPGGAAFDDFGRAIKARVQEVVDGEKTLATELLVTQALSLDAIFTEFARRAAMNLGDYPLAAERYARLAFKAQSNSRATLEALAKLHQPREQTVRHVHVNEGGQAVIADQFHHHTGGQNNAQSNEQPHATGPGAAGTSPALPCRDPIGPAVPIPGGEGQAAMQDARRQGQRGT